MALQTTPRPQQEDRACGGTRSRSGSTYGDFAPRGQDGRNDPSRGAELERDVEPRDADYGRRPDHAGSTDPLPTMASAAGAQRRGPRSWLGAKLAALFGRDHPS